MNASELIKLAYTDLDRVCLKLEPKSSTWHLIQSAMKLVESARVLAEDEEPQTPPLDSNEPWFERMQDELEELSVKIVKLKNMIQSEKMKEFNAWYKLLMRRQLKHMESYAAFLERRIKVCAEDKHRVTEGLRDE